MVATLTGGWDSLEIGTETGRIELVVTDAMIDAYLAAMELDIACYRQAVPPFDCRIAPPDMVPKLAMTALFEGFCNNAVGPNIRAKQHFAFYAPVRVGAMVRATGHVIEKYERRGRRFVTLEALFVDGDGAKLALDRRTQLVLGVDFRMGG